MPITTVVNVKAVIGSKYKDDRIIALIPMVENDIRSYCNDSFAEGIPEEYELNAIKMIQFHLENKAGLTNEGLSRHSVGYSTEYPKSITRGLKRKLVW
ncbi:phage head-tail connector protein [Bacillus solitudinis]|uniref:phage head-tail connector protein n=1 Tax=Bacillus solitudinis TaxID=2014074 RepID=UPI000C242C29|nr:phage head-tail connector protein [Bacillus solitudinis]